MITRAEVEKLGAIHAVAPTVLSLYLSVPRYSAELCSLTAHADELVAIAEGNADPSAHLGEEDRSSVRNASSPCPTSRSR